MPNNLGSQWGKLAETPFRRQSGRRRYHCPHNRRKSACRDCGGMVLAVAMMYKSAKWRANRDGLPCTITQQEIQNLVGDGICPVLGIPYHFSSGHNDFSPSLDKFNPGLGYTVENCYVISNLANRIKSNATSDQVQNVATWMKSVESQKNG